MNDQKRVKCLFYSQILGIKFKLLNEMSNSNSSVIILQQHEPLDKKQVDSDIWLHKIEKSKYYSDGKFSNIFFNLLIIL